MSLSFEIFPMKINAFIYLYGLINTQKFNIVYRRAKNVESRFNNFLWIEYLHFIIHNSICIVKFV